MARYKKPWAEVKAEVRSNASGGDIDGQIDEARAMWDSDPTHLAPQTRRETIQEAFNKPTPAPQKKVNQMANFNQYRTTPYATKALNDRMASLRNGRTQAQYGADIAGAGAPMLPSEQWMQNYNGGDAQEAFEQNFNPQLDIDFKAANPKHWDGEGNIIPAKIPGMSDEYNANAAAQRMQATALRSPTPQAQAPAPQVQAPAPQVQAPAPQVQAPIPPPPSQVQQNMNQPIVKKPIQNYNATQTANSGWMPGGWGG